MLPLTIYFIRAHDVPSKVFGVLSYAVNQLNHPYKKLRKIKKKNKKFKEIKNIKIEVNRNYSYFGSKTFYILKGGWYFVLPVDP